MGIGRIWEERLGIKRHLAAYRDGRSNFEEAKKAVLAELEKADGLRGAACTTALSAARTPAEFDEALDLVYEHCDKPWVNVWLGKGLARPKAKA